MSTHVASTAAARWRIPAVLAVTVFVNYLDRTNLSLAIPRIAQDFGWSDREIGANGELLLGAFFLSYALSNMLLSPLAERFGPKRSTIVAIAAFSVITMLSAPLGTSLTALIVLRLLLGVGEGVHIPMLSAITSRWFALGERSRANTIWGSGILLATASAPLIVVPLTHALGWRFTFAVLGLGGMLLSIPLLLIWVQDVPPASLSNAQSGKADLAGLPQLGVMETLKDSYVRDRRFWLVVFGGICNAFCAFGVLNWLPTYFNRAKGVDFEQLGWPLALIFTAGIVGMGLMAYWGDRLQQRTRLAGLGFLAAAVLIYVASTQQALALLILCFALAVFCQSAYAAQEYAIVQRLLPAERVGAGTGLYNGLTILLGGVGGSLIPGSIVAATGSFDAGMLSIVVGAVAASGIMFVLARVMRY